MILKHGLEMPFLRYSVILVQFQNFLVPLVFLTPRGGEALQHSILLRSWPWFQIFGQNSRMRANSTVASEGCLWQPVTAYIDISNVFIVQLTYARWMRSDAKTRRRDEDIKPKMNTVVISLGLLGLIGLN